MTAQTRATLYNYFLTNAKPTQAQFTNLIDSSLNLVDSASQSISSTVTFSSGNIVIPGLTSGTVTIASPAIAGSTNFVLPPNNGTSGYFLRTDGTGTTTWVASSTSNPLPLGTNGGTGGSIVLNGSTSGSGTIAVSSIAGTATNFTLPATNGIASQVLITDGSGNTSWSTSISNGMGILLNTQTPSGASSISFSSTYITNTYNQYEIRFYGVFGPSSPDLYITTSVNNGSSYLASNYKWSGAYTAFNTNTPAGQASLSDSQLNISLGNTIGATSVLTCNGRIQFSNPNASSPMGWMWQIVNNITNGGNSGNGFSPGTTAINNIKIAPSVGTFTGTFELWGIQ